MPKKVSGFEYSLMIIHWNSILDRYCSSLGAHWSHYLVISLTIIYQNITVISFLRTPEKEKINRAWND
jgi:hypothetical protein